MSRLVFLPLDATGDLLSAGWTIDEIEEMYNPKFFFDEVYVISTKDKIDNHGTLIFIKAETSEIRDIIMQVHPDVVRANAGFGCSNIAAACRVSGIPVMISVHDSACERISQSLEFADKVVYISGIVKQSVINRVGVSEDRLMYLPRYIDRDVFKKRHNSRVFNELTTKYGNGKHILHVGRRTEQKNLENTIGALKYLPNDYVLLSIGKGSTEKYEEIACFQGVDNRVFFLEALTHEELSFYYSWCDCMCTPSRWEGFGLVFIEACACECIVVTSNIAPMNEYLEKNKSAFLVDDIENPKEIAEEILKACQETETINLMKTEALEVAKKFDKQYAFSKEIENYKTLISEGPNRQVEKSLLNQFEKLQLPIVIYGAGTNGKFFLNYLRQNGKTPLFFVDQSVQKQGRLIDGIEICSISKLHEMDEEFIVVVTPFYKKDIINILRQEEILFMEMEWYCALLDSLKFDKR